MWKVKLKRILGCITAVSTGTLLACILWHGIVLLERGEAFGEARIPYLLLAQILLLGVLCGLETEFILLPDKDKGLREDWTRVIVHFVCVTGTALICGYLFGWYTPTFSGIALMCLISIAMYGFTYFVNYWNGKKEADRMNERLNEIRQGRE